MCEINVSSCLMSKRAFWPEFYTLEVRYESVKLIFDPNIIIRNYNNDIKL